VTVVGPDGSRTIDEVRLQQVVTETIEMDLTIQRLRVDKCSTPSEVSGLDGLLRELGRTGSTPWSTRGELCVAGRRLLDEAVARLENDTLVPHDRRMRRYLEQREKELREIEQREKEKWWWQRS
jgi:hypothetical protein